MKCSLDKYSVFEYLYRDGGNFKSWGTVLLHGSFSEEAKITITACLIDGMLFIAKDVGLPELFEGVTQGGSSDLDHPWHEMADLRPATPEDMDDTSYHGTVQDLVAAFKAAKPEWSL